MTNNNLHLTTYEPATGLHSTSWIFTTKVQFAIAAVAMTGGIVGLPIAIWARAYLFMATLLLLSSTVSLTKVLRDLHETDRLIHRVDEARIEQLLAEDAARVGV